MGFVPTAVRRRRSGGSVPPPSLAAQMQALLAGTTGFVLDPSDNATMWQDSAKTTPLTADGQTIGAIRTKWGTTQYDIIQATGSACPLRQSGKFIVPDGVDDYLGFDGAMAALQNVPGYFCAFRFNGAPNNNTFPGISTATATSQRLVIAPSAGRMRTFVRRLDADALTDNFGTDGTTFAGGTVAFEQDLATTGNAVKYKDNVSVDTYTLAGSPANSENTASSRMRLFCALTNNFFQSSSLGRLVLLPFIPSGAQRTLIQSWLTEV